MRVIGLIPARYKSSRLEGKALADILGKPMIQHVYERARLAKNLDDVVVATDDQRIYRAVLEFGGKAVMTSAEHRSGTDRVGGDGPDGADVVSTSRGTSRCSTLSCSKKSWRLSVKGLPLAW